MSESFFEELRERARGMAELAAAELDHAGDEGSARAALAVLAREGLLDFTVAALHGGAEVPGQDPARASVRALCTLRDELAYHHGLLDLMLVMQGLGSYPLQLGGSGAAQRETLDRVRAGTAIAAYGLTEPEAGSDLGNIATAAVRSGAGYTLDGQKVFISNAPIASFFTVLARTSGTPGDRTDGGLSMFFVPADAPGLSVEGFEVMAPHPIGTVRFENVQVEGSARLGAEGEGLELAFGTLGTFRTTVAAAANGFARRAFDESRRHLSARRQFGRPLGANQGLRFDLAEMDTRLTAAQLLVDAAARACDADMQSSGRAVARAKLFATETASWICDRAVQHHGGLGVKKGMLVEQLFREVRSLRIYEGASEVQKLILGKLALENPPAPRANW